MTGIDWERREVERPVRLAHSYRFAEKLEAVTTQGVINNFFSTRVGLIARAFGRLHGWVYARTNGRVFKRMFGGPVVRVTVRGRRSGEPRSVMLMLVRRGDDLLVCGSNGGNPKPPPWYLNLVAAGEAEVQVGLERWTVKPRKPEGAELDECWRLLVKGYPDFETYDLRSPRTLRDYVLVLERVREPVSPS